MTKKEIITGLLIEIDRNLYLQESEKNAWKSSIEKYPQSLLLYFFKLLKTENQKNTALIQKALKANPSLTQNLKGAYQKAKLQLITVQETEKNTQENKNLEKSLFNQL